MKAKQILITNFLLVLGTLCFSQDRSAFRQVKEYYYNWGVYKEQPDPIVYNRKTYKLAINDDFIIPILSIKFRYEQTIDSASHVTMETVLWECEQKDCIFEKEHLQNISTCRIVFHKKEECMKFIKLLSVFRFAVELKQKNQK